VNYDDVKLGDEIPPINVKLSILQVIMYCAVTWDFARIHYDPEFVNEFGFSRPVVDPQMHGGFIARMLTDWVSESGKIKKISLRYRAPCFLGEALVYSGKVAEKYVKNGERYVNCDLVVKDKNDQCPVEAKATILFH
jgi:acyl dehydratase